MGRDIHTYIEYREAADSAWQALGAWQEIGVVVSDRAHKFKYWESGEDCYTGDNWNGFQDEMRAAYSPESRQLINNQFDYMGRDPVLFAALCGISNRYGVIPIDELRGMPDDVTIDVRSVWLRVFPDFHSESYLSLSELALWDGWDQTFRCNIKVARGRDPVRRLSDEEFETVQKCANKYGKVPWVTPDDWNLNCTGRFAEDPKNHWRSLSYKARLESQVGADWWLFLAKVYRLGVKHGADNVRLVFWFDN